LKPECGEPVSNVAFSFNLRRYDKELCAVCIKTTAVAVGMDGFARHVIGDRMARNARNKRANAFPAVDDVASNIDPSLLGGDGSRTLPPVPGGGGG
jgi:hypothetical protein